MIIGRHADRSTRGTAALVAATVALTGCSDAVDHDGTESTWARESSILGGVQARGHRDAALVESLGWGFCSGSVIAPRVVLTAAHCIRSSAFEVVAPFAAHQKAQGSSAATFDATGTKPWKHDVGLVFLDSDIGLDVYPTIASTPVASGTPLISVGRLVDGSFSYEDLFVSPLYEAAFSDEFPKAYDVPKGVIEPGDSGGPAKLAAAPSQIVGVGSLYADARTVIARVDLVSAWIGAQIAAHPGDSSACATCGGTPADALPSCGDLAQAWGTAAACEVNGNGACGGVGSPAWDCDVCCPL